MDVVWTYMRLLEADASMVPTWPTSLFLGYLITHAQDDFDSFGGEAQQQVRARPISSVTGQKTEVAGGRGTGVCPDEARQHVHSAWLLPTEPMGSLLIVCTACGPAGCGAAEAAGATRGHRGADGRDQRPDPAAADEGERLAGEVSTVRALYKRVLSGLLYGPPGPRRDWREVVLTAAW